MRAVESGRSQGALSYPAYPRRIMKLSVRWLPALLAPVLIAGAVAVPAVASAAPATKTPQQVLALIADSTDAAYSGTITQTSDLGLPQLPATGPGSATSDGTSTSAILELLTSAHTARVFVDGSDKERVQVLDQLAERDAIHNGTQVWTYDSKRKTATHLTFPSKKAATASPAPTTTPSELAKKFIDAVQPSTKLKVANADVAGRTAYALTLTPATTDTLVGHVTISVDAETGLPLKVVVEARGQKSDAFSLGFSKIDFSKPAASLFEFSAPKGTTVTTHDLSTSKKPTAPPRPGTAAAKPTVTGTGWTSVVQLPGSAGSAIPASQSALLDELTTAVPGGRVLQTSLISVLLTDDGRVFAGAVPAAALEAAAQ